MNLIRFGNERFFCMRVYPSLTNAPQMMIRLNPKLSIIGAYNTHFCLTINILHFTVVIMSAVDFNSPLNKLLSRQLLRHISVCLVIGTKKTVPSTFADKTMVTPQSYLIFVLGTALYGQRGHNKSPTKIERYRRSAEWFTII